MASDRLLNILAAAILDIENPENKSLPELLPTEKQLVVSNLHVLVSNYRCVEIVWSSFNLDKSIFLSVTKFVEKRNKFALQSFNKPYLRVLRIPRVSADTATWIRAFSAAKQRFRIYEYTRNTYF